jgi:hypothetical protein
MSDKIEVPEKTKAVVVQFGPQKLFGDFDKRQAMDMAKRVALFDTAWKAGLEMAVVGADHCEPEWALERLKDAYRPYFQRDLEHREFRFDRMQFIAQLRKDGAAHELNQLWFVPSSDRDPKVLYVRFDTEEERKRFGELASELGWNDEDLGLRLVSQFMQNCRPRAAEERVGVAQGKVPLPMKPTK